MNFLIQEQDDPETEAEFIKKDRKRKSTIGEASKILFTQSVEMSSQLRINQVFSFENILSMHVQIEKLTSEITQIRRRLAISEIKQAEKDREIEQMKQWGVPSGRSSKSKNV